VNPSVSDLASSKELVNSHWKEQICMVTDIAIERNFLKSLYIISYHLQMHTPDFKIAKRT